MKNLAIALLVCAFAIACGDEEKPSPPECTGEECIDAGADAGGPVCGDGVTDPGETCDDGNDIDDDACRNDCTEPVCGDGIVDAYLFEPCDDGNDSNEDDCRTDCSVPKCGDGILDDFIGEECDDGDALSNDGCSSTCTEEEPFMRQLEFVSRPPELGTMGVEIWDANRGQLLVSVASGTWILDARGWRLMTTRRPADGFQVAHCANHVANGTIVCYASSLVEDRSATVIWDGGRWITVEPETMPPTRVPIRIVYNPKLGKTVMYGGFFGNATQGIDEVYYDDVWEWDGENWTEVDTTNTPDGTQGFLAYHPIRDEMIMSGVQAFTGVVRETWAFDGTTWRKLGPLPENGSFLRWDPETNQLLFLGENTIWALEGDEWVATELEWPSNDVHWNGTAFTSSIATVAEPPPMPDYRGAIYDALRGNIIFAGGGVGNGGVLPQNEEPLAVATGLYGMDGWESGPPSPEALTPALAYDANRKEVLFIAADTYRWDGESWTLAVEGGDAQTFHAAAWSPGLQAVVRFGGKDGFYFYGGGPGGPEPPPFLSETQAWTGTEWETIDVTERPSDRWLSNAIWDIAGARIVLEGGYGRTDVTCCTSLGDLWSFDGVDWTELPRNASIDRILNAVTYDPQRGTIFSFGGLEEISITDTIHELVGDNWTPLDLTGPLAATPVSEYHALHRRTLVFDGTDVWEFGFGSMREACFTALDGDNDGLAGCDDPDCWGFCNPECPPGARCAADVERCGDGRCNENLETSRLCPQDCGEAPVFCGDYHCDAGEAETCPGDC